MKNLELIAEYLHDKFSLDIHKNSFFLERKEDGSPDWDAPFHKFWMDKAKKFAEENPENVSKMAKLIDEKTIIEMKIDVLLRRHEDHEWNKYR